MATATNFNPAQIDELVSKGLMSADEAAKLKAKLEAKLEAKTASASNGKDNTVDEEKKPPRVAKTPLVTEGPSQDELLQKLATGKIKVEDYKKLAAGSSSKMSIAIGASGWISLYYGGRFPANFPVEVLEFIMSDVGSKAIQKFIADNAKHISRK